ncbi:MAG TPA: cell division protein FtsQ/DivIB [Burkholderiales bacterium]|nr:cell division protein FtsQ/DivIB [Burkholderiales bacterium]
MPAKARSYLTLAAGIVTGMAVLGACFGALYWLLLPQHFPLTRVDLKGTVLRTTTAELEAALPRASGNFFAADLGEIRARVERLPWVRHVAVRRVWPGRLEISIEEHVALARWGDEALVNTHGERFVGKTQDALPSFIGPAGTQAEVARRYARFSAIVAPLGTKVERVVLSARHAWQLRLANGLHLALGRDPEAAELRLKSFVAAYPATLSAGGRRYEYVDLRYPNGFAVRVPDLKS